MACSTNKQFALHVSICIELFSVSVISESIQKRTGRSSGDREISQWAGSNSRIKSRFENIFLYLLIYNMEYYIYLFLLFNKKNVCYKRMATCILY